MSASMPPIGGTDKWYEERGQQFRDDLRKVISNEQDVNAISWLVVDLLNEAHDHWNSTHKTVA